MFADTIKRFSVICLAAAVAASLCAPASALAGQSVAAGAPAAVAAAKGKKVSLKKVKWSPVSAKAYNGKKYKPVPKGIYSGKKLKRGRDFTIKYTTVKGKKVTPKKKGTYKAVVKGKGGYTGSKTFKFRIAKKGALKWVKAKTHEERVLVKAAWDEPIYEEKRVYGCACGWRADPNSPVVQSTQAVDHQEEMTIRYFDEGDHSVGISHPVSSNYSIKVQVGTEHHDAIYKTETVVDRPGYWK